MAKFLQYENRVSVILGNTPITWFAHTRNYITTYSLCLHTVKQEVAGKRKVAYNIQALIVSIASFVTAYFSVTYKDTLESVIQMKEDSQLFNHPMVEILQNVKNGDQFQMRHSCV